MKFAIVKLAMFLTIASLFSILVSALKTSTNLSTNLNMGFQTKSGMNMNLGSNYKMSLKGFLSKSHKKIESAYSSKTSNNKKTELSLLSSKILFRGWIKYFKFPDDETIQKPKEFFRNPLYERDSRAKKVPGEVTF